MDRLYASVIYLGVKQIKYMKLKIETWSEGMFRGVKKEEEIGCLFVALENEYSQQIRIVKFKNNEIEIDIPHNSGRFNRVVINTEDETVTVL